MAWEGSKGWYSLRQEAEMLLAKLKMEEYYRLNPPTLEQYAMSFTVSKKELLQNATKNTRL